MKKILTLVLVLSFVLGSFGFAFAASRDVKNTNYEDAVSRLMVLEIIFGFPDGTFRPNETLTRAQCAKIMFHALGLGSAAKYEAGVFDEFEVLSTDSQYAVVIEEPWLTSDGWEVELDVFEWGEDKFIIEDNSPDIQDKLEEGKVIEFTLNGNDEIGEIVQIVNTIEIVDEIDGKYIDIDTSDGTDWLKFDDDAVIYLLDEDSYIDKRLGYDDIYENDKVTYALNNGKIAALTVVTEAYEKEDDDTNLVTEGTVNYINDPGNSPSSVVIEVVDEDTNFTEYARAAGEMSLSIAKFLCADDNEDIIDGAEIDFELDSDGNIFAIKVISLTDDHSTSDLTITDSSVVDGLLVRGNDYKLDDVIVDADFVTIQDTRITGNLVINGEDFTSIENIITGITIVNGENATVDVTWIEAPANITGAIAAEDYSFAVDILGTSNVPNKSITKVEINNILIEY